MTADRSLPSTPTPLPAWITRPTSWVYAREVARRAAKFDEGKGVVRLDRPVLSVGNLSVGGTGKTPVVGWIIERLLEMGCDPAVAMRGYRSRGGLSDEAMLHAERFGDLPVVAQPHRLEGLIELFATERGERVDAVVLDDGFQHRRIARDLDLVLLDATRDPFGDELLPAGWLREPGEALARATHVAITHAESADERTIEAMDECVELLMGRPADAVLRHTWTQLEVTEPGGGGPSRTEAVSWLAGRVVVAACAIGNPGPFLQAVGRATGQEVAARVYRDHHALGDREARELAESLRVRGAQALVVTQKDWTKLSGVASEVWPCPVVRPVLEVEFARGESELADAVREAVERVRSENAAAQDAG